MFKKSLFIVGATIVLTLIGLVSFPYTKIAYGEQGCLFQGSWYGYKIFDDGSKALEWTANVQGQSHASGTNNLEDPSYDPTLNGTFPNAVRITTLRGTWERIGSNIFGWTFIGFGVDVNGSTVWIGKLSGTSTLDDNCSREWIEGTLEVFAPNQDPFGDETAAWTAFPSHYGYRMRVDPPHE